MDTTVMAFSREEAAKLSQLSVHQLRAWATNLYGPSWAESGMYTFVDLVALRALGRLRKEFNVPPRELRRASQHLRQHSDRPWSELKLGVGPKNVVYFWDRESSKWISANDKRQTITPITLDQISRTLKRDVATVRRRPKSAEGVLEKKRGVMGGQLRFKGTRITVRDVREMLVAGHSVKNILKYFPSLTDRDIAAARKLAAA